MTIAAGAEVMGMSLLLSAHSFFILLNKRRVFQIQTTKFIDALKNKTYLLAYCSILARATVSSGFVQLLVIPLISLMFFM